MAEDADGRGGLKLRVAAVRIQVVDVHEAGGGCGIAHHSREQAALLAQDERLVRRLHRGSDEGLGPHGMLGVGHVDDRDSRRLVLQLLDRLHREEQRGVVVRALVAGRVHEPLDLEAAGMALVAHELRVAHIAVVRHAGGHAALELGLGARPRAAVRSRRNRRLGRTVLSDRDRSGREQEA